MKQQYQKPQLKAVMAALAVMFDKVFLVDPRQQTVVRADDLQPTGKMHPLPMLTDDGRGCQPVPEGAGVGLEFYQAVEVDGLNYVLAASYSVATALPTGDRAANAFSRLMAQYAEDLHRDYVTGVYNRRFLDDVYAGRMAECLAGGKRVSIALARVNEQPQILSRYGNDASDRCLTVAAGILQTAAGMEPENGILARLDGGLFLISAVNKPRAELEHCLQLALDNGRREFNATLATRIGFTVSVATAEMGEGGSWDMTLALAENRLPQE